jgi:hypothetical protein
VGRDLRSKQNSREDVGENHLVRIPLVVPKCIDVQDLKSWCISDLYTLPPIIRITIGIPLPALNVTRHETKSPLSHKQYIVYLIALQYPQTLCPDRLTLIGHHALYSPH